MTVVLTHLFKLLSFSNNCESRPDCKPDRTLSLDEYVEYPGDADGVDGRHEDLVELQLRPVYVLGYELDPRHPAATLAVPEVLEDGRLDAWDLVWSG